MGVGVGGGEAEAASLDPEGVRLQVPPVLAGWLLAALGAGLEGLPALGLAGVRMTPLYLSSSSQSALTSLSSTRPRSSCRWMLLERVVELSISRARRSAFSSCACKYETTENALI